MKQYICLSPEQMVESDNGDLKKTKWVRYEDVEKARQYFLKYLSNCQSKARIIGEIERKIDEVLK